MPAVLLLKHVTSFILYLYINLNNSYHLTLAYNKSLIAINTKRRKNCDIICKHQLCILFLKRSRYILFGISIYMSLHLEVNETQQLMQNEVDEEEQKISQLATSPVTSNKLSSGAASLTSRNLGQALAGSSLNESTKVSYVSERRLHRDLVRSNYSNRPKSIPKEAPDVKDMEKSLLELLDDFHTGKLSAFGPGCSMEQMINIRDQQEHLARLHFRLCADVEKPTEHSFDNSASRDKMAQLVQSLEQLSASIERLQSDGNVNDDDP